MPVNGPTVMGIFNDSHHPLEHTFWRLLAVEGGDTLLLYIDDKNPLLLQSIDNANQRIKEYHFERDDVPQTRWFGGWTSEYQIETTTLAGAITEAGMRMQYVMFDDCFMSSVEAAYDLGDYIAHLCTDENLLDAFNRQLDVTVPYKAHTPQYYSASNGFNDIRAYSGITTSAPSHNTRSVGQDHKKNPKTCRYRQKVVSLQQKTIQKLAERLRVGELCSGITRRWNIYQSCSLLRNSAFRNVRRATTVRAER